MFFNTKVNPIQARWRILPGQVFLYDIIKTSFVEGVRMYDLKDGVFVITIER